MQVKTIIWAGAFIGAITVASGAECDVLANPERGFRIEQKIGLEDGEKQSSCNLSAWKFRELAADGVTMAQAYCYLSKYSDVSIPQSKLDALQADFNRARTMGIKFLLRFAYETDMSRMNGPTLSRILSHIIELRGIVRRNVDVIYALQIGWVGAWGEFHASASGVEFDRAASAKVVKYTLDYMLPENRSTMLRTMQLREDIIADLGIDGRNIGIFNDATLADFHDSGTFMGDREVLMKLAWDEIIDRRYSVPGNQQFDALCRNGSHIPVDGELFWKGNVDWAHQNGLAALIRLQRHHYTTFSIVHGNSELDNGGGIGAIDTWKKTPLTEGLLASYKINFDPDYFKGVPYRTAFEYIRDHLGYRLVAKSCKVKDGKACVVLHNFGFSAPINPRFVYFVVLSIDGKVVEVPTGIDCRTFGPDEDVVVEAVIHKLKKDDRLALWLPDQGNSIRLRPEYAIQLARCTIVETAEGHRLNILDIEK